MYLFIWLCFALNLLLCVFCFVLFLQEKWDVFVLAHVLGWYFKVRSFSVVYDAQPCGLWSN